MVNDRPHEEEQIPGAAGATPFDVVVVGAGPAGLIAAEQAVAAKPTARVLVLDAQRSPGRKLLLAGRSGLNITNSERLDEFLPRFTGSAAEFVRDCIEAHPPADLAHWCAALGQPTIVGSSGRVFPTSMRSTPLLRAWVERLGRVGVTIATEWRVNVSSTLAQSHLIGANGVGRRTGQIQHVVTRSVVLALGGGSWPRTGSDGAWVEAFDAAGVAVISLAASNVGVHVEWSERFVSAHEGEPIKNIELNCAGIVTRGDLVVTRKGLEGGAVYALSPQLRSGHGLTMNLRPNGDVSTTAHALGKGRSGDSLSNRLRKTGLSKTAVALVIECGGRASAHDPYALAELIHRLPISVVGLAPIERAISSSGGVAGAAINDRGMLLAVPGVFVAGEMLDWEAPTGGYLLQACWSTGWRVGQAAALYRDGQP